MHISDREELDERTKNTTEGGGRRPASSPQSLEQIGAKNSELPRSHSAKNNELPRGHSQGEGKKSLFFKVDFEDGSAHRDSVSMPVSRNCSRSQGEY